MSPGSVPAHALLAQRLNEQFPSHNVRMEAVSAHLAPVIEEPRFLAVLFGVFAAAALLLASTGV